VRAHRRPLRHVVATIALLLVVAYSGFASAARAATPAAGGCAGPVAQRAPRLVDDPDADGITRVTFTFVDRNRPVDPDDPGTDGDAHGCRMFRTTVSIPAGATTPLPLVLAVHGRDGDPVRLEPLVDAWVRAGQIVAAPQFLVTDKDADDKPTPSAVRRQAADARFVLDHLLLGNNDPGSPLHGLIDPHRIGAAGMSLGGMTVYGLVANTCCRDPRITAAVLLAAVRRDFDTGRYVSQHVPVMLIQGDADIGYHNSVTAYRSLAAPKWFITLRGSTHSPPFEVPRGHEAPLVDRTTTEFWDRYFGGRPDAEQQIVDAVTASGFASLQRQLAAG
jgi:dienelactone hydrolase